MIKKILKTLSKSTIAALSILGIVACGALLFESYIYDYKGASVVKLTRTHLGRSGGTGFAITAPSGKKYTLTNAHICRIAKSLVAHKQDGSTQKVKVVKIYENHDLCIMEPVDGLRSLKIANNIFSHERVWLVGHPALRGLTLESGHFVGTQIITLMTRCTPLEVNNYVSKLTSRMKEIEKKLKNAKNSVDSIKLSFEYIELIFQLQRARMGYCLKRLESQHINNIAYGGNSGSPVVDKFGNVIGVLFAGRRDQPTASYTVPLKEIKEFLKDK